MGNVKRIVLKTRIIRKGLAPLELVLWLPFLLLVMALFVNLGTMTAWRIRGEQVSRDAAWRHRWPRTGDDEPRPPERIWPQPATMEVAAEGQIDKLADPRIELPVARGPMPGGFTVNDHLKMDKGAFRGSSEIERDFPLIRNMEAYESGDIRNPLLDMRFSAAEMGMESNTERRTLVLYEMPKTDPSLPQDFIDTIIDLLNMEHWAGLAVLDRSPEIQLYRGGSADFHPRISRGRCTLDHEDAHEQEIERVCDHYDDRNRVILGEISRVPRNMSSYFLSMYQQVERELEQNEADEAQLEPVREAISQLESFRGRLGEIESGLKARYEEYAGGGGAVN
jgi:hypothetical protein